ncbi:hypothetical protein FOA52_005384 [Chlamydomonas sp. UWO 241]|nr:hypothetical protein FOA52_005384 [Chlamydomonas sp. UWO 241]
MRKPTSSMRAGGGMPVVVIDNGGGNLKVGIGGEASPRSVFSNCSAKAKGERAQLIGDMLADHKEISQLAVKRPMDRGYLVNFDLEREIWGRCFRSVLKVNPADAGMLLTEPLFNFPSVQAATEQIAFEEFGVASFYQAPAPLFSLRRAAQLYPTVLANQAGCGIVVDAGFSFTHAVPFFNGQLLLGATKRINVGGKALTNYFKELVSYRSLNMMDETVLMDHIKDQVCFVSQSVKADLMLSKAGRRSPYFREYVLPDGVNSFRGFVREPPEPGAALVAPTEAAKQEQVLQLNNERFMVPELLFSPSDISLQQAGVAEAVVQAVSSAHAALRPLLYTNVILTGGLCACPGFSKRFRSELRPLVPDTFDLGVCAPPQPANTAWEGMSAFVAGGEYAEVAMTKAEYEETGGSASRMRDQRS